MLAAPQCDQCGASTDATQFEPLGCKCECGHRFSLSVPTGGVMRQPELKGLGIFKGGRWKQAMLEREGGGYMVLTVCPSCSGPVKVSRDQQLAVKCTHCGSVHEETITDHVVDVVPTLKVSAQTWGGGMSLVWTPAHHMGAASEGLNCPGCGAPVPPFSERHTCGHCQAALLSFTACGKRFVPGVRIVGDDEGRKLDEWRPLHDALDHYGKRLALAKDSGKVTRRAIGCGFLSVLLAIPLMCIGMAVVGTVAQFDPEAGLSVGIIGMAIAALLVLGGFIGALLYFVRRHKKKRESLL